MRKVKMRADELYSIVLENRAEHKKKYNRALAAYFKTTRRWLEGQLEGIDRGEPAQRVNPNHVPEDHSGDYDRALDMIAHHVGDTVVLSGEDYDKLVRDEWDWKRRWEDITGGYL